MKPSISCVPVATTGEVDQSVANGTAFGNKRAVGALAGGMSVRWVDGQLARGMPHMKFGPRRVRFDLQEVREWLKERYGQQRVGSGRATKAVKPGNSTHPECQA